MKFASVVAIVDALEAHEVRYMLVGGVAVVAHGHLRFTQDVDLVVDLREGNAARAVDALDSLRYRPRAPVPLAQFADEGCRREWIESKGLVALGLWSPEHPETEVDLMMQLPPTLGSDGAGFDELWSRSTTQPLGSSLVRVIGLQDLLSVKRLAGRAKDLVDVEELEAVHSHNE